MSDWFLSLFFQGLFQDLQSPFLHELILWMTYHILIILNVNFSQWKLFCFCVFLVLKFSGKILVVFLVYFNTTCPVVFAYLAFFHFKRIKFDWIFENINVMNTMNVNMNDVLEEAEEPCMICDAVRLGEIKWNLQTWKASCEDERGRLYLISSIFLKMPCWCQLTTGIGNCLCAALADVSAMLVFLCLWPRIPLRILMRSSMFLNIIGKSISLPKTPALRPKSLTLETFYLQRWRVMEEPRRLSQ